MSFLVTAQAADRDVVFQRGSMLAALEQALMLASSGLRGVRIVDSQGRSHTPTDLSRLLLETRRAAPAGKDPLAA